MEKTLQCFEASLEIYLEAAKNITHAPKDASELRTKHAQSEVNFLRSLFFCKQ